MRRGCGGVTAVDERRWTGWTICPRQARGDEVGRCEARSVSVSLGRPRAAAGLPRSKGCYTPAEKHGKVGPHRYWDGPSGTAGGDPSGKIREARGVDREAGNDRRKGDQNLNHSKQNDPDSGAG